MFTRDCFTREELSELERIIRDHTNHTNEKIMKEMVKEARGDALATESLKVYRFDIDKNKYLLKKISNLFDGTIL